MIRRMIRILVVPVLGLLAPTTRRAPALARPRRANSRGRVADLRPGDSERPRRRLRPAALSSLGAVAVALVIAGCGAAATNSTSPAATGARTTPAAPASAVTTPANAPMGAAVPAATPKPKAAPNVPAAAAGAPAEAAIPTPKPTPKAPAAAAPKNPDAGIPQGNGGDADPDNTGGANDGDGPI